ncbi:NUMOD4 domain-containing protein [Streptomyces sp. NPDC005386]|uniref:NUMOD4 domain-containing protein n=1 Tax=Streptomyces sp. NPDC005386 TaxID=3154562 RepID=UPI0033A3182F
MSQRVITEEWRKIPGFSPVYEVSNFGEVRSLGPRAKGRVLRQRVHRFSGLPQIALYERKQKVWRNVHELVAAAFPEEES